MRHHKGIGREVVTKKESSGPETISNRTIAKLLKLKLNRNRASPNYVHFMLKRLNHQNPCMKASFTRIHARQNSHAAVTVQKRFLASTPTGP